MIPHSWFRFPFRWTPPRQDRRHQRPLHLESLEDRLCLSTWSDPVDLGPVINCLACDTRHPAISADGLSLYITSIRPGGSGGYDLWVSQRDSLDDPWGEPQDLGPAINTAYDDRSPTLSADQHWLFFGSNRPDSGYGGYDIWASYRECTKDDFGWQTPINLGSGVNSKYDEDGPTFFEDDQTGITTLYFTSLNRPDGVGDWDIYASTLQDDGTFGSAVLVPELSSPFRDTRTAIRSDGLEMFLTSNQPGGLGSGLNIWVSTRESTLDTWSPPVNLGGPINLEGFNSGAPALSADGNTMFFYSDRPGSIGPFDLYMSTRQDCSHHPRLKESRTVSWLATSLPAAPAGQAPVRTYSDPDGRELDRSDLAPHSLLYSESAGGKPAKPVGMDRSGTHLLSPASHLGPKGSGLWDEAWLELGHQD